jgi:hypothetical protein
MTDEDLRLIFEVSKALKEFGGKLELLANQRAVKRLTEAKGLRLRFEGQLRQGEAYVKDLGAKGEIFSKMTDGERERLFDLANANRGTGNYVKQASHWALSRKPADVYAYVALVEMYVKKFEQAVATATDAYVQQVAEEVSRRAAAMNVPVSQSLRTQVQKELSTARFKHPIEGAGKQLATAISTELEKAWGALNNVTQAGPGAKIVQEAYSAGAVRLKGHLGSTPIGGGLAIDEMLKRLKKLPEVRFGSEASGVYHVEKHGHELPPSEVTENVTTAFLASARKTIQAGTFTHKVSQGGTHQFHFVREFLEDGRNYEMYAIVNVTESGEVSLATYMNRRKK